MMARISVVFFADGAIALFAVTVMTAYTLQRLLS
jgi:hypothetical protein